MSEQQPAEAPAAEQETTTVSLESKNPLMNKWTMWFDSPSGKSRTADWGALLKRIMDFDFVEDFWGMYNNILPVSKLAVGGNYHMFKTGIEPKWEDPQNTNGGKWVLMIPKKGIPGFPQTIDDLWLDAVLACIGEQFDETDEITGIVVSPRAKGDRISLWTRNRANEVAIRSIGQKLKQVMGLPETVKIQYQYHSDALDKNSSFNNAARMEV